MFSNELIHYLLDCIEPCGLALGVEFVPCSLCLQDDEPSLVGPLPAGCLLGCGFLEAFPLTCVPDLLGTAFVTGFPLGQLITPMVMFVLAFLCLTGAPLFLGPSLGGCLSALAFSD